MFMSKHMLFIAVWTNFTTEKTEIAYTGTFQDSINDIWCIGNIEVMVKPGKSSSKYTKSFV